MPFALEKQPRTRIVQTLVAVLCIGAAGPVLSACAEQKAAESPLKYAENAKRAYMDALEAFFDRDWEYATQLLNDVKRKYGYSRYARLAELRLADIAFHQEKYAEAAGLYKSFVTDYPNDPEVPFARYRIAKAEFVESGASVLLPPLEERDLSNVRDAHVALRALIADYPDSKHATEVRYMLEVVAGLLSRHELYVARFYLNRDNFDAAVARCEYAIRTYQGSGLEPEALVLLGETFLKQHETEKARATFELVIGKYPDSAFIVPARRFLERMARTSRGT